MEILQKRSTSVQRACSSHTHIKHGELAQDSTELLIKRVLRELDLAHIEVPYPADLEIIVDDLYIPFSIHAVRGK